MDEIQVTPQVMMFFESEDREPEIELWKMRFKQIKDGLVSLIGETDFNSFEREFFAEITNYENFFYYTKFIFSAIKTKESK